MTRRADVPDVMARVAATLDEGQAVAVKPRDSRRVLEPAREGDVDLNVGRLRRLADVELDFPSGSDRPLVGGAVRLAKKAVRRALRWYVAPIMEQQSRFNHATLDLIERLRLRLARLGRDGLAPALELESGARPSRPFVDAGVRMRTYVPWFRGCRRVVHVDSDRRQLLNGLANDGTDAYGIGPDDDAVEHLRGLDPGSVDGLFLSLVESPMPPGDVVALLRAARHALAPHGVVVIETASAADLTAGEFTGDRATRPVHPEALRAALEATGFSGVRSEVLAPTGESHTVDLAEQIERLDDALTRRHVTALVATRRRAVE